MFGSTFAKNCFHVKSEWRKISYISTLCNLDLRTPYPFQKSCWSAKFGVLAHFGIKVIFNRCRLPIYWWWRCTCSKYCQSSFGKMSKTQKNTEDVLGRNVKFTMQRISPSSFSHYCVAVSQCRIYYQNYSNRALNWQKYSIFWKNAFYRKLTFILPRFKKLKWKFWQKLV